MKQKIVMLTAYDYPTAKIIDEVGIDYILVGDSLGMVVLGYKDTKSITMDDMLHHVKAVVRGATETHLVADMPINTYNTVGDALKNARLFIGAGAYSVKIEGNKQDVIKALIKAKIPVMGHLGLLPQTAEVYKVQGKEQKDAKQIYDDAKMIDKLGIYALVLECVPAILAKKITDAIQTPTIGIGAGVNCSGQVLVLHDIIGLSDFQGKFVKQYANVKQVIRNAVEGFKSDVISKKFPTKKNSFA